MNNILSFTHAVLIIVTSIFIPVSKPAAQIPPTPIASASAAPQIKQVSTPQPSPLITPSVTQADTLKPKSSTYLVRAEDTIDYMNQKTTYYIDIPKNGGRISGMISGLCSGEITGEFNGQLVDYAKTSERHDLTGEVNGTCKVGFIPIPASAKFYGEVSFSTNRVSLTVDVEKPFKGRYYPSLKIQ